MPPKTKDPAKPKGRKSAYAFFLKSRKDSKGSQESFADFSKSSAKLWHDMTNEEKAKYYKMQEDDKKRYDREMSQYEPPPDDKGRRRRRKKKKDKDAPKRAMSGFMHFCAEKRPKLREENPKASVGDLAKQLGAAWKIMTVVQKKPYEELAQKDRDRYDDDMQVWREKIRLADEAAASAANDDDDDDDDDEDDDDSSD